MSFDQIRIILSQDLPSEAFEKEAWWSNDILNANGPSRIWLDAGWKVNKVNLFSHEVYFNRLGVEEKNVPISFKKNLSEKIEYLRRTWFNLYPDDPEHFIPIEINPKRVYWLIVDENFPKGFEVLQKGRRCGYIFFTCHDQYIEIDDIHVNPEHRESGLGTYMMRYFLLLAQKNGFQEVRAKVQPESGFPIEKLMAWYQRFGFQSVSTMSRLMVCKFEDLN